MILDLFIVDFSVALVELETECKARAFVVLGSETDVAIVCLQDVVCYYQTQADSLGVHLFCALQTSKQLEQVLLVLPFDSHAGINHCHN